MAKDKIFVGSGRESGQFGYIAIGVAIEDIQKYAKKSANGKHYVNLLIGKRKEVDQYGKTHWVAIDEWEQKSKEEKKINDDREKELGGYGKPVTGTEDIAAVEDDELDVKDIPF